MELYLHLEVFKTCKCILEQWDIALSTYVPQNCIFKPLYESWLIVSTRTDKLMVDVST